MSPTVAGTGAWCTFDLDGGLFGVDVGRVQEVLRTLPVTRVPLAPPTVSGLLNLRGQIVPALDLRACLGLPPAPEGAPGAHVVVLDGSAPVSLRVDAIRDVQRAPLDAFEPSPATLSGASRALVRGAVKLPDRLLLVLDLDPILRLAFTPIRDAGRTPPPSRQGDSR